MSYKSGVGALQKDDEFITDDKTKAEILNNAFIASQQEDNGVLTEFHRRLSDAHFIDNIDFNPIKIHRIGRRIKPKLSNDTEGYNPYLLTKVPPSLSQPLSLIFHSFMSTKTIPNSWKQSIVTPIFKKGLASDPNNYRPIAITSVFSKLMERVIVFDTSNFLRNNKLISKAQHGFIRSKSTCTNLLESVHDWTINFNAHSSTDVAYIDFAKAFDKVSHNKLIHKLEAYGIAGDLLAFLQNFISNRKQCTKVNNALSVNADVRSGVIQGSCIGPFLFVIFINDITENMDREITPKLYADDIKLYTRIETTTDIALLQANLDYVIAWSQLWQMKISATKCFILPIGGKFMCLHDRHYILNNITLPTVFSIRDLGITIDQDLTFTNHVNTIVSRASIRSNLILRCFVSGDRNLLLKAFTVYVRPILEFDSPVWSPRYQHDIERLESVQRRFTKRLTGLRDYDYLTRLKVLHLETLELRRMKADLILTYKILFGHVDLDPNYFFNSLPSTDKNTRGHAFRLSATNSSLHVQSRHFFSSRILNIWNNLPESCTNFATLNNFKSSLSNEFLFKFCTLK